jgi:hypothetical protein
MRQDFKARCVPEFNRLFLEGPGLPTDVAATRCDCVLRKCQHEWDADEFEEILLAISQGGYSQRLHFLVMRVPTTTTFPSAILDMMQECSKRGEFTPPAVEVIRPGQEPAPKERTHVDASRSGSVGRPVPR